MMRSESNVSCTAAAIFLQSWMRLKDRNSNIRRQSLKLSCNKRARLDIQADTLLHSRPNRPLVVAGFRVYAEVPDGLVDLGCGDNLDQSVFAGGERFLRRDPEPVLAGELLDLDENHIFVLGDGAGVADVDGAYDAHSVSLVGAHDGAAGGGRMRAVLAGGHFLGVARLHREGVGVNRIDVRGGQRQINNRRSNVQMNPGVRAFQLNAGFGCGERIQRVQSMAVFGVYVHVNRHQLDQFRRAFEGVQGKNSVLVGQSKARGDLGTARL